jgi:hypothetical protein
VGFQTQVPRNWAFTAVQIRWCIGSPLLLIGCHMPWLHFCHQPIAAEIPTYPVFFSFIDVEPKRTSHIQVHCDLRALTHAPPNTHKIHRSIGLITVARTLRQEGCNKRRLDANPDRKEYVKVVWSSSLWYRTSYSCCNLSSVLEVILQGAEIQKRAANTFFS